MFHDSPEYLDFAAKLLEKRITGTDEIRFGHVSSTKADDHVVKMLQDGANAGMSKDLKYATRYHSKIRNKLNELREGYAYEDNQSNQHNSDVPDK